jgi:hypothetical protein
VIFKVAARRKFSTVEKNKKRGNKASADFFEK